jgi:hypothetical protein
MSSTVTVSEHPIAKARREHSARAETVRGARFARRLIILGAKLMDLLGDTRGQQLAVTAAAAIDDLIEHTGGEA